jgi:8-oxo-dGTP diphosphatase
VAGALLELTEPHGRYTVHTDLVETGAGTLAVHRVSWHTPGRWFDVTVGRRVALRLLHKRTDAVATRCAQLVDARIVVGAEIVRDGKLLAQQRAYPESHAGQWELPGGRVEPDETPEGALVRECLEELGVPVVVGEQTGPDVPLKQDMLLRVFAAKLDGGEPEALEHKAVRWLTAGELDDLDWLPADRHLVPALRELLT